MYDHYGKFGIWKIANKATIVHHSDMVTAIISILPFLHRVSNGRVLYSGFCYDIDV